MGRGHRPGAGPGHEERRAVLSATFDREEKRVLTAPVRHGAAVGRGDWPGAGPRLSATVRSRRVLQPRAHPDQVRGRHGAAVGRGHRPGAGPRREELGCGLEPDGRPGGDGQPDQARGRHGAGRGARPPAGAGAAIAPGRAERHLRPGGEARPDRAFGRHGADLRETTTGQELVPAIKRGPGGIAAFDREGTRLVTGPRTVRPGCGTRPPARSWSPP